MLHPDDREYFNRLQTIGLRVAAKAGIRVAVIEPKRRPGTGSGVAYLKQERIAVAVRGKQLARDGGEWSRQRYPHAENLHTLAHELAHLAEHQAHGKSNHGPRFRTFETPLVERVIAADAECEGGAP